MQGEQDVAIAVQDADHGERSLTDLIERSAELKGSWSPSRRARASTGG